MSLISDMLAAAGRLLTYYNGNEKTADNPGGMTGVGGMADNWDPCIRDIGTAANGVGAALTSVTASEGNAAASATAAAGSATGAAGSAAAAHADRLAADTAAAATAADRLAVAADKATVADDKTATHTDRLAADAAAVQAQAAAAGLSLPAITAADASKVLEVKPDGSGWQLTAYLKSLAGTATSWIQTVAGVDAGNLGLRIGEATSGFYRSGVGIVGFAAAGVEVFRTAATGALMFYRAVRGQIVALTWTSTITIDANAGNYFSVTLGGATTFANPTNLTAGQPITVIVKQDGTGSRTASWGSYWKFPNGVTPTLTTTAGKTDRIVGHVVSATEIHANAVKGF